MSQTSGAVLRSDQLAELYAERQRLRDGFADVRTQVSRMGTTLAQLGSVAIDSVEPDLSSERDLSAIEAEVRNVEDAISLLDQQLGIARDELTKLEGRMASEAAMRWQTRVARAVLFAILLCVIGASALRIATAQAG